MPYVVFLSICVIWGSNFILMSRAASAFGPVDIAFWRLSLGGGVMMIVWLLGSRQRLSGILWFHVAVAALLGNAAPFVLIALLIAQGFGHSFFALIVSFVPLITILASGILLREWPGWRQWVGVLGGFAAISVLFWEGISRGITPQLLGLAFLVPLFYSVTNTYIRWKLADAPTAPLTAGLFLLGALFLAPIWLSKATQESWTIGGPVAPRNWKVACASVAWLGVMGTGITGFLFVRMIQSHGPLFAGMATYLIPLVALLWGAYDNETITGLQLVGMAAVLAMVSLAQWKPASERPESPSSN